jgi:uncharacterized protein (TIGR02246 family)
MLIRPTPSMSKTIPPVYNVGGTPDEVEAQFYDALKAADIEKLMDCWADDDNIVCIHPGGPRVVGNAAIRAAFDAVFGHEGSLQVHPESIRRVDTLTAAVHSVLERVEVMTTDGPARAYVLATNVFQKTLGGWRLVAHHASPGSLDEVQEINLHAQVLH